MSTTEIYERDYVIALFDEMAATYNLVNSISSFGFCHRWRRQCVQQLSLRSGNDVADLMCGMGELIWNLDQQLGSSGSVLGIDYSPVMCQYARENIPSWSSDVTIINSDVLESGLPSQSLDAIVSCFGLKTLSESQLGRLASEVKRVLRRGGQFSFLEISVPSSKFLRAPFMFYLNHLIPIFGKLLLGNPDNYRMLGVYTAGFGNCNKAEKLFREAGLEVESKRYFFGCASGLVGRSAT